MIRQGGLKVNPSHCSDCVYIVVRILSYGVFVVTVISQVFSFYAY